MRTLTSRLNGLIAEIAATALLIVLVLIGFGILYVVNQAWGVK